MDRLAKLHQLAGRSTTKNQIDTLDRSLPCGTVQDGGAIVVGGRRIEAQIEHQGNCVCVARPARLRKQTPVFGCQSFDEAAVDLQQTLRLSRISYGKGCHEPLAWRSEVAQQFHDLLLSVLRGD